MLKTDQPSSGSTATSHSFSGDTASVASHLSQIFVELEVTSLRPDQTLSGSVSRVPLGDLELLRSTIPNGGIRVRRSAALLRHSTHQHYYICCLMSGVATLNQGGAEAELIAADIALLDSSQTYTIDAAGPIDALWIAVPRYRIEGRLAKPSEQLGQRIDGAKGSGSLASGLLVNAFIEAGRLPAHSAERVGNTILDLVALALTADASATSSRPATRLQGALDYIEAHLCEPKLSPHQVAQAQAITTRHLNTLFSRKATSTAKWIRLRRLERCRADLQSNQQQTTSIATIALNNGFSELSTFNRAFKKQFGVAPSALRNAPAEKKAANLR